MNKKKPKADTQPFIITFKDFTIIITYGYLTNKA